MIDTDAKVAATPVGVAAGFARQPNVVPQSRDNVGLWDGAPLGSEMSKLQNLLAKPEGSQVEPRDRPVHTLALRVLRAAYAHALFVSLRDREHDGGAASVRSDDGGGGRKIFHWSQFGR